MIGISWKLYSGSLGRARHGEIFHLSLLMENSLYSLQSLVYQRIVGRFFFELRGEIDAEWIFADGSYIKAHQHASGARGGQERAIGRSVGGGLPQKFIFAPMRMEIRSILKSLGVKSTTHKLHQN